MTIFPFQLLFLEDCISLQYLRKQNTLNYQRARYTHYRCAPSPKQNIFHEAMRRNDDKGLLSLSSF